MAKIKKAQIGKQIGKSIGSMPTSYKSPFGKKTRDSTNYFHDKGNDYHKAMENLYERGYTDESKAFGDSSKKAYRDEERQSLKGKPGYDANGRPVRKPKESGLGRIAGAFSGGAKKAKSGKSIVKKTAISVKKKK